MLPTARQNGRAALLIAVSGGLDSVCLAHLLHGLAARLGIDHHLAHVDHGLRPESAEDAAFVARLAAAWAAPFHQTRLDPARLRSDPTGLEAAARQARYAFLRSVAREIAPADQTPVIATAHHADDQAETVIFRLLSGSGVHGLAGMRWVTEWPMDDAVNVAVRIVRPMLGVRRSQLLSYAQRWGLSWREDATNQDVILARNRLRRLVLPQLEMLNPAAVESICRSAETLANAAQQISQIDENLLATLVLEAEPTQRMVMDLERLRRVSTPQVRSLVYGALRRTFPHLRDLGFSHVEQIAAAVRKGKPTGGPHPVVDDVAWTTGAAPGGPGERRPRPAWLSLHDRRVLPVHVAHPWLEPTEWRGQAVSLPRQGELPISNRWVLHVEQSILEDQRLLPVTCDPWQVWLDADRCGDLQLTAPEPGRRITPLGLHNGRQTLGDFFTNRKLPTALRSGWPLVMDARTHEVIWVCGLAIGEGAALRVGSRRVLHLRWQSNR